MIAGPVAAFIQSGSSRSTARMRTGSAANSSPEELQECLFLQNKGAVVAASRQTSLSGHRDESDGMGAFKCHQQPCSKGD